MRKGIKLMAAGLIAIAAAIPAQAERTFVHPGCSYTKGQLDRMKAMVEAKVEPYYTTFINLKNSEHANLDRKVTDRGNQIREGQFNGTVGIDGRCAHDLALLWHITGDKRYADKAVEYLNANNHYTNTSSRGTGPLDNGKINLLIEAAELMRDYEGWDPAEQQKFKDMLTYPYYSQTEDVWGKYGTYDDNTNGVTFYWNILNGDASRYGNQGMFGMLGMLAMGVYLDNEVIYDRALRYISGLPHRADDLPYVSGPPVTSAKPSTRNEYQLTYELNGRKNDIEDYGYDELLEYYFYPNGQCQESSRDQGHVMAGLHKYLEFAEIAWNQGDRFYSLFDNRLLKGAEFNIRYNLTHFRQFPDQSEPWEPTGYTTNPDEVTLENGMYLQTRSRSGRWESVKPSPDGRGAISNVGSRENALNHYKYRAGESDANTLWLRRAHDYVMEAYGYETSGTGPSWYYEWNGWGTLTKTLTTWMAGDPVSYASGSRVSGIHTMPGSVAAADYDYYNISEDGEGHTYHKVTAAPASAYRPDGGVALRQDGSKWVVSDLKDGEWLHYTVALPAEGNYDIYVTYKSNGEATLAAAVSGSDKVSTKLPAAAGFAEAKVASIDCKAGAAVLRLIVDAAADGLEIESIRMEYAPEGEVGIALEGSLDARNHAFHTDWTFTGVIPSEVNLLRSASGDVKDAEVISSNNTFGTYVDNSVEMTTPAYTYWVSYVSKGEKMLSEPVSFAWGELADTFVSDENKTWNVMANNGEGVIGNDVYTISLNASGAARISRAWSFPFHSGNFPILAFSLARPEGVTAALYTATNSWGNGYDTFSGKVGTDVFYYDLANGSFQNSKGVDKVTLTPETTTPLPLQLRLAGPASAKTSLRWVRTFKDVDALKAYVAAEEAGVDEIGAEKPGAVAPIYNLTGLFCGYDMESLPAGIYICGGKKVMKF